MKSIISFVIRKIPRKYLQIISPLALKVLAVFYTGNKVECPVCSHTYRKFLPYGRVSRPNALCPSCLALERHRLMWLYLNEKTNFFKADLKVLHIAPEHCFIDRFEALKNLDYITADLESPLAKVKMDIHKIPFADNTFDVAFCNHVMEHVESDVKALSEIYRVLKPTGWAIIQSPMDLSLEKTYEDLSIISPAAREKAYGQNDHVRTFGRDYKERLEKGGFKVKEDKYVMEIPAEKVMKYALPADEVIYLCSKA
ncbi:MAG TPA: methyltransferase domain-containing protein [Cytophagaceae bacterium]|nr:methyltransferase domain-containing protein [Cytophagaceae bacterium]